MPEVRRYRVTRTVIQNITANTEVDALRIAEHAVPIQMISPKPGSTFVHMDDDTYGYSEHPRIGTVTIESAR